MYPRMCKLRNPQHSNVPTTAQFRRATQLRSRSDGLDGANELPGLSVCEAGTYIVRERVKIPIESTLTGSTELCDPRTEGARHYIVRVSYPPLAIRVRRARERSYGTCRTVVVQIKDALHSICAKHGNSRVTPPGGGVPSHCTEQPVGRLQQRRPAASPCRQGRLRRLTIHVVSHASSSRSSAG